MNRYQETVKQLRWFLRHGETPYHLGTNRFTCYADNRGRGVFIRLKFGGKLMAIIDSKVVRIRKDTVYRHIFEKFAKQHKRRILLADRLEFNGKTGHYGRFRGSIDWQLQPVYEQPPVEQFQPHLQFTINPRQGYGDWFTTTIPSIDVDNSIVDGVPLETMSF